MWIKLFIKGKEYLKFVKKMSYLERVSRYFDYEYLHRNIVLEIENETASR